MISNVSQGRGYGGCLRYCDEKKGAELVATNCMGENPAEIGQEMNTTRDAYEGRATKTVYHVSLNPAEGDQVKDPRAMGEDYMREMGMDPSKHEYAMYRHNDTGREHYHLVANRISRDGSECWNDSNSRRRSMAACRAVELKHGLQVHQPKQGQEREAQRKEEAQEARRHGWDKHPKQIIRDASRRATTEAKTPDQYRDAMKAQGVDVHMRTDKAGKVTGMSYGLDERHGDKANGRTFSGTSLGGLYTARGVKNEISDKTKIQTAADASRGKAGGLDAFKADMKAQGVDVTERTSDNGRQYLSYQVQGEGFHRNYSGGELGAEYTRGGLGYGQRQGQGMGGGGGGAGGQPGKGMGGGGGGGQGQGQGKELGDKIGNMKPQSQAKQGHSRGGGEWNMEASDISSMKEAEGRARAAAEKAEERGRGRGRGRGKGKGRGR